MLSSEQAVQGFAAVGSGPRMHVLQTLIRAGDEGLLFGELVARADIPASTLSHHLRHLADAGLVTQEKLGRQTRSRPDFIRLEQLSAFLLVNCCADARNNLLQSIAG
jgi:DNA-binding transcriptional ArsR family regulator